MSSNNNSNDNNTNIQNGMMLQQQQLHGSTSKKNQFNKDDNSMAKKNTPLSSLRRPLQMLTISDNGIQQLQKHDVNYKNNKSIKKVEQNNNINMMRNTTRQDISLTSSTDTEINTNGKLVSTGRRPI